MKTSETVIYDSAKRGSPALEELRGIFEYRDLVIQLVRRDIVARYKRSILGVAWTMLNPLGMMIVLTVVFSQLFQRVAGYPAYILSGLLAWNFFSQTTTVAMRQMVWGGLVNRIYMPRTAFVVSSIGTGLVNIVLGLVSLLVIIILVGLPLRWTMLFLPIAILLLAAFALGISLLLSAWAIYFPDVAEMYHLALMAWMYLTPIIYPKDIIPETYRFWFFHLNPMYYMVEIFRRPIYEGVLPSWPLLAAGIVISLLTLTIGWFVFSWKSDEIAYRT